MRRCRSHCWKTKSGTGPKPAEHISAMKPLESIANQSTSPLMSDGFMCSIPRTKWSGTASGGRTRDCNHSVVPSDAHATDRRGGNTVVRSSFTGGRMAQILEQGNCGAARLRGKEAQLKPDEPTNPAKRDPIRLTEQGDLCLRHTAATPGTRPERIGGLIYWRRRAASIPARPKPRNDAMVGSGTK
jgi:hypothetical protein